MAEAYAKHRMPIPVDSEGRRAYGSGPVKILMRDGKMLAKPEFIPVANTEETAQSHWEVQKKKRGLGK